jgi:hypothetical protein
MLGHGAQALQDLAREARDPLLRPSGSLERVDFLAGPAAHLRARVARQMQSTPAAFVGEFMKILSPPSW